MTSLPDAISEDYERLSAKDSALSDIFTAEFLERFEVHSYRNASRILAASSSNELSELVESLMSFNIKTENIVKKGGNKSLIAKSMDDLLFPKGWYGSRIRGDLVINKLTVVSNPRLLESKPKKSEPKTIVVDNKYVIDGFIDGHKVDFVKNRVAFDMEWNSKDQTFDRDLYAARTFYECGIVDAGILLTRSKSLGPVFAEIGNRVNISNFKSKYGASTTWMGKLLYRLDAGRGGGCPILAIGIKPPVIEDFEYWKSNHPVIVDNPIAPDDLTEGDGDDDNLEE
ncbi:BglII/BstYI family type II restriction endonuclease [Sphingomonas sp. PAMC 26605]|uniref:BglII/BstYI family type II restriction endonuclease n=1 Tax=Sphingomonas sp. PAMC 26605 TaxID=1112214 RepID=UPI00026CDE62|nr:BglII/BstYI family type II restriction endonuclease [Sphingomonas sp. PAMC 26605]